MRCATLSVMATEKETNSPVSLFNCEICGNTVDPKGKSTVQLVNAWIRGGSRALFSIEDRTYRYRHEVCCARPDDNGQQESLFG